MAVRVCRWGILSTATIGRKNWQAIHRAGNATLMGVASRNLSTAQKFIDENQQRLSFQPPPRAFGSYQQLIEDPNIDAVYIPLPTGMRKDWVIRAAEHGKHVLCEKPCAVHAKDLHEMLDSCRRNKVQFMDGVMYMHSRRLEKMRSVIDDQQTIGDLKRITTQFSFCAPQDFFRNNIRVDSRLEPQGCLGDLGWYTIRFALWAMQGEMPNYVYGRIISDIPCTSGGPPIPTEFSGEMFFGGGVSASFYNSFITGNQQWAVVSGTKGLVQVNDYVLPYFGNSLQFESRVADFNSSGWDFNMECFSERYSIPEFGNMHATAPETNLFRNFSDLVLRGQCDPSWGEWAMKTQLILDACLESGRHNGKKTALNHASFQAV